MKCEHEIWDAEVAVHDGLCPLCLQRELAEARKDAERYRWLRDLKCNSVTVGHDDEHACNYYTAKDWIENHMYEDEFDGVPVDELQRMKDSNSIWAIQIYPHTPVGFNKYYGATLDAAIDAALSQSGNDKSNISESIRAED